MILESFLFVYCRYINFLNTQEECIYVTPVQEEE